MSRLPAAMLPAREESSRLRHPFLELHKDISQLIPDPGKSLIQINDYDVCLIFLPVALVLKLMAAQTLCQYSSTRLQPAHLMLSYLKLFLCFLIISNVK